MIVAITLLNVSPALIWASARSCNNRRVNLGIVGSGAVALADRPDLLPAVRESPRRSSR